MTTRASYTDLHTPRPLSEWREDMGDVMWWFFPMTEAPWVGTPLDLGQTVSVCAYNGGGKQIGELKSDVGGWPGYHTHFTPLPNYDEIENNYAFTDWGKE